MIFIALVLFWEDTLILYFQVVDNLCNLFFCFRRSLQGIVTLLVPDVGITTMREVTTVTGRETGMQIQNQEVLDAATTATQLKSQTQDWIGCLPVRAEWRDRGTLIEMAHSIHTNHKMVLCMQIRIRVVLQM